MMLAVDGIKGLSSQSMARLPMLSRVAFNVAFTIATWQLRSSTRKNLQKLDLHLLRDIGLDAQSAQVECTKRFWQD